MNKIVPVGEVVKLSQGFAINKKTIHHMSDKPTKLKLLRIGDMKSGNFSVFVRDTIPEKFIVDKNDIIYTRTGRVGLVFRGFKGVIHNNCFSVTPKDTSILSNDYLYYALQTKEFFEEANAKASGAAQPDLTHSSFKSICISLPQIEVQEKIANTLKNYDELISINKKKINLLKETVLRCYNDVFSNDELTEKANNEGWEEKRIQDLCVRINSGGTPSRKNKNYWNPSSINWFKTGELKDGWLLDSEERISEIGLNNSSAKLFPKNTIMMAIYASPTLGKLGILTKESSCNQAAICMVVDEDIVSWQWMFLKLYDLRKEFNAIAKGAGQQNISGEAVKRKRVIVPPREIMKKFSSFVEPLFEEMLTLQKENNVLTEIKSEMLSKTISSKSKL